MVRLLSMGIGIVSTTVVLLPVLIILHYLFFRRGGLKKTLLIFVFAAYLSAVFTVVGIPTVKNFTLYAKINWIPILDIVNSPFEYAKNTVLNILLFIPLGFLLPSLWSRYRSMKKTLLIGLGFSLLIEILQIFTFRLTDIDDLLTNTAGTVIGYLLSSKFSAKLRLKLPESDGKYEPFLVGGVVFLIMFTVQPWISEAIWNLVLSSSLWESIW